MEAADEADGRVIRYGSDRRRSGRGADAVAHHRDTRRQRRLRIAGRRHHQHPRHRTRDTAPDGFFQPRMGDVVHMREHRHAMAQADRGSDDVDLQAVRVHRRRADVAADLRELSGAAYRALGGPEQVGGTGRAVHGGDGAEIEAAHGDDALAGIGGDLPVGGDRDDGPNGRVRHQVEQDFLAAALQVGHRRDEQDRGSEPVGDLGDDDVHGTVIHGAPTAMGAGAGPSAYAVDRAGG